MFPDGVPLSLALSRRLDQGSGSTFLQRLIGRWINKLRYRAALPQEYHLNPTDDYAGFSLTFTAPRVPLGLSIKNEEVTEYGEARIESPQGDSWREEPIATYQDRESDRGTLFVRFKRLAPTTKLQIFVEDLDLEGDFAVVVVVGKYPYPDWVRLTEARELLQEGNFLAAIKEYKAGLGNAPANGTAAFELAMLCKKNDDLPAAERWALNACAHGELQRGIDFLRDLYQANPPDLRSDAVSLEEQSAGWPENEHYGAVCLLRDQFYWGGFGTVHLYKHRSLVKIKRRAAARMLRRLHFEFAPHNEALANVQLRILHEDQSIKEVPEEQLTVADAPEHDPAIRTAEKKEIVCFLPELHAGDIIEMSYAILHNDGSLRDELPNFYRRSNLVSDFPTYSSVVRIRCPQEWPARCVGIHGSNPPTKIKRDDDWQEYLFTAEKLICDDWGQSRLERTLRCPHGCVTSTDRTWEQVGIDEIKSVGTDLEPPEPLPPVVREVIDREQSPIEKMRGGYYWIRDRIKYMSLVSAKRNIAKEGRARRIVEQGVGDCHDKAYLLSLLCKELKLPAEFLLIGMDEGFIVRELPGSQFDHIILRTRLDGDWVYLDATDTLTPFGLTPTHLQGLPALRLGNPSKIITIPEQSFAVNRLDLGEELVITPDGDLRGTFTLEAWGVPGRWLDEHWKVLSMGVSQPRRAAQVVLQEHLPNARIERWAVSPYDPKNDYFSFSGKHFRCNSSPIVDYRVAMLNWRTPFMPIEDWRDRNWQHPALLPLPMSASISVSIQHSPDWRIFGSPGNDSFAADCGTVSEEHLDDPDGLAINRTFTITRRFLTQAGVQAMPAFLDKLEEAMQLAIVLRNGE